MSPYDDAFFTLLSYLPKSKFPACTWSIKIRSNAILPSLPPSAFASSTNFSAVSPFAASRTVHVGQTFFIHLEKRRRRIMSSSTKRIVKLSGKSGRLAKPSNSSPSEKEIDTPSSLSSLEHDDDKIVLCGLRLFELPQPPAGTPEFRPPTLVSCCNKKDEDDDDIECSLMTSASGGVLRSITNLVPGQPGIPLSYVGSNDIVPFRSATKCLHRNRPMP